MVQTHQNPKTQDQEAQAWQDLLNRVEAFLRRCGHWEKLGPLAPLVRLLIALAIRFGARKSPEREAVFFLAQWELAEMLGITPRTLERYLYSPRYERYRRYARLWLAWRVWFTDGQAIGAQGAVKGGTVWRVKLKPKRRPFRVLAPHLRLFWRDLGEDVRRGATARGVSRVSGYKSLLKRGGGITLRYLNNGTLSRPWNFSTRYIYPDTSAEALPYGLSDLLRPQADLEAELRAPGAKPSWVQGIASQIVSVLRDRQSLRFWYRVLWAALRKGEAARRVLFRAVIVAKEASEEGFARKPGAYAQYLLRRWSFTPPGQPLLFDFEA